MGFLDLKTQKDLAPLLLTDTLVHDLAKLDKLPERDCYSILVLYHRSGSNTIDEIYERADSTSKSFDAFVWSLGWPIEMAKHLGFKGSIHEIDYEVAPYFANIAMEMIFKCPQLKRKEQFGRQISWQTKRKPSSNAEIGSADDLALSINSNLSKKHRPRSQSVGMTTLSTFSTLHLDFSSEIEMIAIVWIEDLSNLDTLVASLSATILICIFVHPLPGKTGLNLIRIICRNGAPDEIQKVGPLLDSMIVGNQSLGVLVRHTAANAQKTFNIIKNNYRKP